MTWKAIKTAYRIAPDQEEYDPNAVIPRIIPPCESCGGTDYIIKLKPERYDSEKGRYYKFDSEGGKIYDPPGVEYLRASAQCRRNYNYDGCFTHYIKDENEKGEVTRANWSQSVHDIIMDPETETWMTEEQFTIKQNRKKKWQNLDKATE